MPRPAAPLPRCPAAPHAVAVRAGARAGALVSVLVLAWLFAALAGAASAAAAQGNAAPAAPAPEVVGTVINAIGAGRIQPSAGPELAAQRGSPVRVGDRIETAAGGHVHIRFVDGALVSVRPSSRLHIAAYGNQPREQAAIKFRLEAGVVRSITGEWGIAQRERFRLNTPLAAIGIKGTDFIVKADADHTLASVSAGAIVMAPLTGACAQALGPCAGPQAMLLSADMAGMMLQLQRHNGSGSVRLVPALDLLAGLGRNASTSTSTPPGDGTATSPTATSPGTANSPTTTLAEKPTVADASAPGHLADSLATAQPVALPLVWLHNAAGWNVPDNTFSQRYSAALAAGRQAVVGNLFITLYRDETTHTAFAPFASGGATQASFQLQQAQATYTQPAAFGQAPEAVAISGASLAVDFTRATFATQMQLASPGLGQSAFSASGSISSNGVFLGQQSGQHLAGAFSLDGRQAGYQFSQTLPNGQLSGITLWGR